MNRKAIPVKTKLILLSQSGGRCSMPDCNKQLTFETDTTKGNLSNFAHIEGYSPKGPRYNSNLSEEKVNSEENLMVVCLNCHKKIDADTETYTVEKLKTYKIKSNKLKKEGGLLMVEMVKIVKGLNLSYFLKHADEIINNTDVLLNQRITYMIPPEYYPYVTALNRKHIGESGNWYIFGRNQSFKKPGETAGEAYARIDHEYCEATGHWDLYEWEEIPKDEFLEQCERAEKEMHELEVAVGGF